MDNNIIDKRTDYIELDEFKNKANVYYQQLTKASPIKGLGSHEHIYFQYGIEWAYNHLPHHKPDYERLVKANKELLEALKDIFQYDQENTWVGRTALKAIKKHSPI